MLSNELYIYILIWVAINIERDIEFLHEIRQRENTYKVNKII